MIQPRPLGNTHIPGAPPAELGRGYRLAEIIDIALKRRRTLVRLGKSMVPEHKLAVPRMKLEAWRTVNRHPWPATVRAFKWLGELQLVMPSTKEGENLMKEAAELVATA